MKTPRHKPTNCPHCGKILDAATEAGNQGKKPEPGSVGVCFHCLNPTIFEDEGVQRKPTDEEMAEIMGEDSDVPRVIEVLRQARQGWR